MERLLILLLLLLPMVVVAAAEDAAIANDFTTWQGLVAFALTFIVGWVFKLLRTKWKVETEHEELDSTKSLWEQRNFLIDNRVIPFALNTAEHWLAVQLPAILRSGDSDWSKHFANLRLYVRSRVVQKFASENLDVLAFLTERELNNLIDRLLVRLLAALPPSIVSFIGEPAVAKLKESVASFVADRAESILGLESKP